MNDLIDFALMRHGKLGEAITKREANIENLRKERDSLEEFVARAQELVELAASERPEARKSPRPERSEQEPLFDENPARLRAVRPARSA